jgi:peptidoglycan hydrolase CwlO-like protein
MMKYDEDGQPMMTNKQMLQMLVREIPQFSHKLDTVAADVDQLKTDVSHLKTDMHQVKSDIKGLRIQLHQNHTSFIKNQDDLEKRVAVLEAA